MKPLTDLEAATIGQILEHQPCTAHFIRKCFQKSPLTKFSGSAGSVYPMMKRLEKRSLTLSKSRKEGNRIVRYYSVHDLGRIALQGWIGPDIAEDAALTVDPLRTRVIFLRHLSKRKRTRWFDNAEKLISAKLDEIKIHLADQNAERKSDDRFIFQVLANENAQLELTTRLKWIRNSRRRLMDLGLISNTGKR